MTLGGREAHHLERLDGALVHSFAGARRQLKADLDGLEAGLQVVAKAQGLGRHAEAHVVKALHAQAMACGSMLQERQQLLRAARAVPMRMHIRR